MKRILVTYAIMAGSTAEVVQSVAEEIAKSGLQVDVLPLGEVKDLQVYDGLVVNGLCCSPCWSSRRRLETGATGTPSGNGRPLSNRYWHKGKTISRCRDT